MNEYIVNLHMHTLYSDGFGTHAQIAAAALKSGLDVVIVTDHNVLVSGIENYHHNGKERVLLLVGQEVHDQARNPQKNHLLVLGAQEDVAFLAYEPQRLLDGVRKAGGLSILAHPVDPEAPAINEADLGWVDWDIDGFTGLEIWNSLSEFKARLKSKLHGLYYLLNPKQIARGPFPEVLQKWDELLSNGKRIVGVGGSDAHAIPVQIGPFRRIVFPYEFHFRGINTHILTHKQLSGDLMEDKELVLNALKRGNSFIGYDLPAPTTAFRFTAQGHNTNVTMGDEIPSTNGVTFQIRLPVPTSCRLIKHGKILKTWENRQTCTYITSEPGAYRVEAVIDYLGKTRGWIYSNPIYVR
jgi:hypothetical protein